MSSADRDARIGEVQLGRWRVDRVLGRGAFSTVYHATDEGGREVAIKVAEDVERTALLRFAREIRVLQALGTNRAVASYVAHGAAADGRPLVIMEFVDGITLQEGIRRCPKIPLRQAVALLSELCRAFIGLHELGVAHRDVKPANILLDRQGSIKLIDFGLIRDSQGILRLLEDQAIASVARRVFHEEIDFGTLAGTIEYMSPEQLLDSMVADMSDAWTGTASDVYALGVILVEVLAGRRPFGKSPIKEIRTRRQIEAYVQWRLERTSVELAALESVDPALRSILDKALCNDPRARQPDCRVMMDELRAYLATGAGVQIDVSRTIQVPLDAFIASVPTRILRGEGGGSGSPRGDVEAPFPESWGIETIDESAMPRPGTAPPPRRAHDATARLELPIAPPSRPREGPAQRGKTFVESIEDDETTKWSPPTKKKRR